MDKKNDCILITLRSFLLPPGSEGDFPLGQPRPFPVSPGTPVGELMERLFAERANQIGLVAINGKMAEGEEPLADGDRVDVYELLGGG
jgi:hypothetical protein